ncbi:MAG: T9SS type A sorting domain-containing protein [bacterium]
MLVLSSEMPGPCRIDSIQLLCGSDVYNHGIFYNAQILCCPTTATELDSAFEENYAGNTPVVALEANPLTLNWVNNTWHGLAFNYPYDYDGASNLIIEYRWTGDDGNSVYDRGFYTTGNRACNANSATAPMGVPRNYMPRHRIFYATTGIAEPAPVSSFGFRHLSAFPNPTRGRVTVRLGPTLASGRWTLDLCDAAGRSVCRPAFVIRNSSFDIDLGSLPSGLYFLRAGTAAVPIIKE